MASLDDFLAMITPTPTPAATEDPQPDVTEIVRALLTPTPTPTPTPSDYTVEQLPADAASVGFRGHGATGDWSAEPTVGPGAEAIVGQLAAEAGDSRARLLDGASGGSYSKASKGTSDRAYKNYQDFLDNLPSMRERLYTAKVDALKTKLGESALHGDENATELLTKLLYAEGQNLGAKNKGKGSAKDYFDTEKSMYEAKAAKDKVDPTQKDEAEAQAIIHFNAKQGLISAGMLGYLSQYARKTSYRAALEKLLRLHPGANQQPTEEMLNELYRG